MVQQSWINSQYYKLSKNVWLYLKGRNVSRGMCKATIEWWIRVQGKEHSCWIYRKGIPTEKQFSSVQWLSSVHLFATPWTTARQASLSITNFQSLLKLMSIESVMPSSHLILCRPLFLLPPTPPSIRDKKALLSNQCKEIEEKNRMGKTDKSRTVIKKTLKNFYIKWKIHKACIQRAVNYYRC